MRVRFQQRVLHVKVVEQDRPFAVTQIGELLQPLEIPVVVLREVILWHPIPRRSLIAARPRLLEKRGNDPVVVSARLIMRVAPSVVPHAEVVLESWIPEPQHGVRQFVEVLGPIGADFVGSIACQVRPLSLAPPAVVLAKSPDDLVVVNIPAVLNSQSRRALRAPTTLNDGRLG